MDLVPLFSNKHRERSEQYKLDKLAGKLSSSVQLFPHGDYVSDPMDGNWLPQDASGKQWNARTGKWVSI